MRPASGAAKDLELATAEVYQPRTDRGQTGPMTQPRYGSQVAALPDARSWPRLALGRRPAVGRAVRKKTAEVLDPAALTWS